MTRNDQIMWFGRIATLIFTIAVIYDVYTDHSLSRELRLTVLVVVLAVFMALAAWQGYIAEKYDGWPVIPLSFRWVVFGWLASFALFIGWIVAITLYEPLYTDLRSAIVWWQFGVSSLWFASRWVTVSTPHPAGAGETGLNPGNDPS